jgi:hypothetical protein
VIVAVHRFVTDDFPVFLHVLGAAALIGSLLFVASAQLAAWRRGEPEGGALARAGFLGLVIGVLPSWIVMRVGAQWAESGLPEGAEDADWIDIGYMSADIGALLILVSIVLSGIGLWRPPGRVLGRVVGVLSTLLAAAYLVATWAMSTKTGA